MKDQIKKIKRERLLQKLEEEKNNYAELKTTAIKEQRFEDAARCRDHEKCTLIEIESIIDELIEEKRNEE